MVSKFTYYTIAIGLLIFGVCALLPSTQVRSPYVVLGLPLVVGIVNGVELLLRKERTPGLLLLSAVVLLIGSVYLRWNH